MTEEWVNVAASGGEQSISDADEMIYLIRSVEQQLEETRRIRYRISILHARSKRAVKSPSTSDDQLDREILKVLSLEKQPRWYVEADQVASKAVVCVEDFVLRNMPEALALAHEI